MSRARNGTLLWAAVAFAVAGVAALLVWRRPEEGELAAARARPVARLLPGAVDELEVERRGVRTTIRRDGDGFRVVAPVTYPAEPIGARGAFEAIDGLDFVDLVTDRKTRHAALGVDDAAGVRVTARRGKGGAAVFDLVIGKTLEEEHGTMVRPAGRDDVWQVRGELHDLFDKATADWRDRSVTTFAPHDADSIEVTAPDGARIVVRKTGAGAGPQVPWQLVESTVTIGKLDPLVPNQIVDTMSSLKASDFADGATAAGAGLAPAALTVTVRLTGGGTATLLIGGRGGKDEFFVRNPALSQIFLVKDFNVERIARRPIQFRDKTLCDINDADIVAFAVKRGAASYAVVKDGGSWKATRPARLEVSSDKVAPLATIFRAFRAPEIAETPPPGAVVEPRAVIVGRSRNKSCTIQVGGEAPGEPAYFVRTPASRDIYVVPKWMIERIAVELRDLER